MPENKLLTLFNALNGVEKRECANYLQSPYFNRRDDVWRLWQYLVERKGDTLPAADAYRCPRGQDLPFRQRRIAERIRLYQAPAAVCNACPRKGDCTGSDHGRQIRRSEDEAYLDRVRGYHATEPYRKAMRKRQVWVEPLFAEAKAWHGLRRFRLRGLPKVNAEALLIAAGQNLKRLLSWRGWGRRPWPSGAPGLVLPLPSAVVAVLP